MIYLDYRKALDSVSHKRLIHKVQNYGFGDTYIKGIKDFLTSRK